MSKRTILVTGGAGFIGSNICNELFKRGEVVVALDNLEGGDKQNLLPGVEFVGADILDSFFLEAFFETYRPDYVIHAAAFAAEGLSHFVRRHCITNIAVGTTNLINASINSGCVKHFSLFSSIAVMGEGTPPFRETDTPNPIDVYGAAKLLAEFDLISAHKMWGMNYNIWRAHNVVGINQNLNDGYRNFATICFRAILENRPIPIFSTGNQTRAFSPVSDVVGPVVASIDRPESHNRIFNVGWDNPVSVMDLAKVISEEMGVPLKVEHLPARHEVEHAFSSHTMAKRYFGDVIGTVSLRQEIKKMAAWVRTKQLREPQKFKNIEIHKNLPPSWKSLT